MKLALKQKLILGFGILAAIVLGIGALSYSSINRILEGNDVVDHTMNVISHLQIMEYNLKKAQSAYRSFLLLHQPEYLKTTQIALNLVQKTALETQLITADNPRQRDIFRQFIPLLQSKLDQSFANIQLCLSGKIPEALAQFKESHNLQFNDSLDQWIDQMVVEEQNLLVKRRDQEDLNGRSTLLILLIGAIAAILFAFGSLLAIRQEILKRERVQEMLQLNEYRLFQFLEAVPLGIFVLDKMGKPFYANQKARELLGHGVIQSEGSDQMDTLKQAYVMGTDQPYPSAQLPMVRALQGEKSVVEDVEIHHSDGRIIPLQIWGAPVFDMKNKLQYSMAIFSDITDRRHVEEMKQSLISVVSHQLKTPVGEINGYVEILLHGLAGPLTSKQSEYLMDMREIGMNNYRLISDLLNLSKIERGLTDASLVKMSLMEIIQLSMRDYESIMARKGLTLTLTGLDKTVEVMVDRDKMVETLRNLINNAIKFTDKGGIKLITEVKDRVVILKVQDSGRGISETAMNQLFTQRRVLGSEAGRAGAGLGLYVAKHFMKAQGGDISAITQAGKGSCFTLTIPRAL